MESGEGENIGSASTRFAGRITPRKVLENPEIDEILGLLFPVVPRAPRG